VPAAKHSILSIINMSSMLLIFASLAVLVVYGTPFHGSLLLVAGIMLRPVSALFLALKQRDRANFVYSLQIVSMLGLLLVSPFLIVPLIEVSMPPGTPDIVRDSTLVTSVIIVYAAIAICVGAPRTMVVGLEKLSRFVDAISVLLYTFAVILLAIRQHSVFILLLIYAYIVQKALADGRRKWVRSILLAIPLLIEMILVSLWPTS